MQTHPWAPEFSRIPFQVRSYGVLAVVSNCCPPLKGRFSTHYSPVRHFPLTEARFSFDLHVWSTPPAFVLSQDQTLHCQKVMISTINGSFSLITFRLAFAKRVLIILFLEINKVFFVFSAHSKRQRSYLQRKLNVSVSEYSTLVLSNSCLCSHFSYSVVKVQFLNSFRPLPKKSWLADTIDFYLSIGVYFQRNSCFIISAIRSAFSIIIPSKIFVKCFLFFILLYLTFPFWRACALASACSIVVNQDCLSITFLFFA